MLKQETPENARELWKSPEGHRKQKAFVIIVSLILAALCVEAVRVTIISLAWGLAPSLFGVMPIRQPGVPDGLAILGLALSGLAYAGWNVARQLGPGMPLRLLVVPRVGSAGDDGVEYDESACFLVHGDGFAPEPACWFLSDIEGADCVMRGSMGGGGHQVRVRLRGHRLAQVVARCDSAAEAEAVLALVQAERRKAEPET